MCLWPSPGRLAGVSRGSWCFHGHAAVSSLQLLLMLQAQVLAGVWGPYHLALCLRIPSKNFSSLKPLGEKSDDYMWGCPCAHDGACGRRIITEPKFKLPAMMLVSVSRSPGTLTPISQLCVLLSGLRLRLSSSCPLSPPLSITRWTS